MKKIYRFILLVIAVLIIGGVGGVIVERLILPYLSTLSFLRGAPILSPQTPIVINRREEVRISDGINHAEIVNRAGNALAAVYLHEGTLGKEGFRSLGVFTGIVSGSDGFIIAPLISLRPGQVITVGLPGPVFLPARLATSDLLTGVSFLKVDAHDLQVMGQSFSRELAVGERLLAVWVDESLENVNVLPVIVQAKNLPAPSLNRTYEFGSLNAVLHTDAGTRMPVGAAVLDRNAALVGMALEVGGQTALVRSEELKLAMDKLFSSLEKDKISWPNLSLSYYILGSYETSLLGLSKAAGILIKTGPQPLAENDLVYAVDGKEVTPAQGLQDLLLGKNRGDKVKLKLLRGGKEMEIELTI